MACAKRPDGLIFGNFWVQLEPSHTQVSLKLLKFVSYPPNITTCPCWESNAMAMPSRAEGLVGGFLSVQAEPSKTQVSLSFTLTPALNPPNRTVCPCAES